MKTQNYLDFFVLSVNTYYNNFKSFLPFVLPIAFIPAVFSVGISYLPNNNLSNFLTVILNLLSALLVAAFMVGLYIKISQTLSEKSMAFQDIMRQALKRFWPFVLTAIMLFLIVSAGIILLIIPGIIFAVWYFSSMYVAATTDVTAVAALDESKQLVTGRWWKVFGFLLINGLALLVPLVILSEGVTPLLGMVLPPLYASEIVAVATALLISPVQYLIIANIYHELQNSSDKS